jgi:tRNA/tmRNA/rRNA uracil-C5-methylase (TrmA/RlmC/RlmD family)
VIENYNKQYFRDAEVTRLVREGADLPPLKLSEFVECSAQKEGYRSKSEFTIGVNAEGEAVVGFNKGSYHNQTIMVETPRNVRIISRQTKLVVALLEHFIRTRFPTLLPYDRIKQAGFWRYLIVRESQRLGQSLVVVVCRTQGVEEKLLGEAKAELTEYMSKSVIGLVGLGLLPYQGEADSVPSEKPELLFGQPYYH